MSEPNELTEGATLGRFQLQRQIGRGGMGVVWSAVDLTSNGRVALKFLSEVRREDAVSHARFLREADLATKLDHPNVVRVHTVDYTLEGTPYLVMDLLEGESLRARLRRVKQLSPQECGRVLRPVAAAARFAHSAGIIHRDLKPENVFLSTAGVRVLDFGIAKRLTADEVKDSFTSTGAMLGTPSYMAPEQIFGDKTIDSKADVWALGIMLYECLSGVKPVEGGIGQILKTITSGTIVPLQELVPDPAVAPTCRFVMTMLSRSPAARPAMVDVERMLASLEGGGTVAPTPRRWVPIAVLGAVAFFGGISIPMLVMRREPVIEPHASAALPSSSGVAPSATFSPPSATAMASSSAPAPTHAIASHPVHAPAPSASDAGVAARTPDFDVVVGRSFGMGTSNTHSEFVRACRGTKNCFATPTTDERWSAQVAARWPKGEARQLVVNPLRNGKADTSAPATTLQRCVRSTLEAASISAPGGQDENGGEPSFIIGEIGYL